jgi:hypothetical protein
MGGGSYDSSLYSSAASYRSTHGIHDFSYSHDTLSKTPDKWKVHPDLDPAKMKNHIRESRDSAEHPESRAVSFLFDVTGSMASVPEQFQKKLNKLMAFLIMKGGLEHPQLMFGGIGDATCDKVPLQISQFESNNLMDEQLRELVLEHGGGGQNTESYELALFAMARCTAMDCLEKRGQKGYLFLSGDEIYYPMVSKDQVKEVLGMGIQEDIPVKKIADEVKEKFITYFIIPRGTSNYGEKWLKDGWTKLFGQNVLMLDDPDAVCELIASTIALNEGADLDKVLIDLKDVGADKGALASVGKALAKTTVAVATKGAKVTGAIPKSSTGDTAKRI